MRHCLLPPATRPVQVSTGEPGGAHPGQRTAAAARGARRADARAKLHERLIEVARSLRRYQCVSNGAQPLRARLRIVQQPRKDPAYIAIHDGRPGAERMLATAPAV
jgi:hypothetical protein